MRVILRLAVLFVTYLVLSLLAGILLCNSTLHPVRRPLTAQDESQAHVLARLQNASLYDISLTTPDHLQLKAWLFTPAISNNSALILLHGLSDNRTGMLGYAELLLSRHFTVLLPDARAHGASSGDLATYGLLERNDIREWFDWLAQTEHPSCIDGFGESMGAAQLLQALAVEPNFCAVAAESSFSNFHEIADDRPGQFFRTGPWLGRTLLRPALAFAFWYGREKYSLDLEKVSPEVIVATTLTPVLLIHGKEDRNIPVRHSERIAARNPSVILWKVPNADHCGAISTAPEEFKTRLLAWYAPKSAIANLQSQIFQPRKYKERSGDSLLLIPHFSASSAFTLSHPTSCKSCGPSVEIPALPRTPSPAEISASLQPRHSSPIPRIP